MVTCRPPEAFPGVQRGLGAPALLHLPGPPEPLLPFGFPKDRAKVGGDHFLPCSHPTGGDTGFQGDLEDGRERVRNSVLSLYPRAVRGQWDKRIFSLDRKESIKERC